MRRQMPVHTDVFFKPLTRKFGTPKKLKCTICGNVVRTKGSRLIEHTDNHVKQVAVLLGVDLGSVLKQVNGEFVVVKRDPPTWYSAR